MQNRKLMQNTALVPSWLVFFGQTHVKCSVNVRVFLTSEQLDTNFLLRSPHLTPQACAKAACVHFLFT